MTTLAHSKAFSDGIHSKVLISDKNFRISYPKTRSPTTMKVIAVLVLIASLSRTAAFVKQPVSSRATTDLCAMKKKGSSEKVCIQTTHEPNVSIQSTSS
jgi:hypothetical protein